MNILKSDLNHVFVRSIVIEACSVNALRKEINDRIMEFDTSKLTDDELRKGKIKVNGETISTLKLLNQMRFNYDRTLDDNLIAPILDILRLRKRARACAMCSDDLRVPEVIRAINSAERSVMKTNVGKDSVVYFVGNEYMVIAALKLKHFTVISLHGVVRNLLSGFNPSQYINLTPQTVYLVGANVETINGDRGSLSIQRLISLNKGKVEVKLRYPNLDSQLNSADGLNKRNWNNLISYYSIERP